MDGLKDYQISVYVANLGKYVEGVLQGAWITLPMPAERLQDTLKTEVGLGGRSTRSTTTRAGKDCSPPWRIPANTSR